MKYRNKYFQKIKYIIAKCLFWVPDVIMVGFQYKILVGRWLNYRHPKRFSEKIQYYKIKYHNPVMMRCVDKYEVRAFVIERLGTDKYLNKIYQVHNNANEIDFSILPQKFVIKTTDGGNGDNVLVCSNKCNLDIKKTIRQINSWRNKQYYIISREWAYRGAKKSRIIVERFLEDTINLDGSIDDFKFLCFNGKFRYLWVDKNRFSNHRRGFWDDHLNYLKEVKSDIPTFDEKDISLPNNVNVMIELSEKLADGFPFARIDWYNIKGIIIFGEITFYPWSGYVQFTPDSFDYELGKFLNTDSFQ